MVVADACSERFRLSHLVPLANLDTTHAAMLVAGQMLDHLGHS